MKKQVLIDERVKAQKRKIGSEISSILLILMLVSILIKQYILHLSFAYYATEFILFWTGLLYALIRNFMLGNSLYPAVLKIRTIIGRSIMVGLIITAVLAVLSGGDTWTDMAVSLVCASSAAFVAYYGLYSLNKKRQATIDSRLTNEEDVID